MASSSSMVEKMGLALVLVTTLWAGAMAQSGCTNVLIGMAPCLNYVTGSSTTPSSSCCSSLASVVKSQPQCLCSALNGGGAALGISINETLALALPAACKVQTPPVSRCNGANNAPSPAPVGLSPAGPSPVGPPPVGSPESSQADSPTSSTSGSGSKTVPENGSSSSNATGSKTVPDNNGSSSDASTNTGSKTVPDNNGASSDASSTKTIISHHLVAGLLIVASFVAAINGV